MEQAVFLMQDPADVMPVEMSLFMGADPPYDPGRATAESAALREALIRCGASVHSVREVLERAPRQAVAELAAAAVGTSDPDRREAIRAALAAWSTADLVSIVIRQPHLRTHADPDIAAISPDACYESYELRPLYGLLFPRDHYVDMGGAVALGRLRRRDRRRETAAMAVALEHLRGRLPELSTNDAGYLEGGDAAITQGLAVLNTGFRSSEETMRRLGSRLVSDGTTVIYVRDGLCRPEEFHLDHWLALGPGFALVAEDRLDSPSVPASLHTGPDRPDLLEVTLGEALAEAGIKTIALTVQQLRRFAANILFLPSSRTALAATTARDELAPLLEPLGVEVVGVPFDEHHKLFGSIHCALNTVPAAPAVQQVR